MTSVVASCVCRICGSPNYKLLYPVGDIRILECIECGFRFPERLPSSEELKAHYDAGYSERRFLRGQRVNARINLLILTRLLGDLRKLKILDVGAGYGFLAHHLCQINGSSCDAVEISQVQRDYARNVLGLKMYSDLGGVAGGYDLILSFEVLEHIADPTAFLESVSKLLKPSGSLILATDNFSSPTVMRMGSSFPKWVPHEHISCFAPTSIRKLFDRLPSLGLVSLKTYASWELRLAATVFAIKRQLTAGGLDSSEPPASQAPVFPRQVIDIQSERNYKFYRPRLLLSPLLAMATLSPGLAGEMMIIHAKRQS
jgi:SAM-dependent methyltransferase